MCGVFGIQSSLPVKKWPRSADEMQVLVLFISHKPPGPLT